MPNYGNYFPALWQTPQAQGLDYILFLSGLKYI